MYVGRQVGFINLQPDDPPGIRGEYCLDETKPHAGSVQ